MRARLTLLALVMASVVAVPAVSQAQTKRKPVQRYDAARTYPQDDQSYLYLSPGSAQGKGSPTYVTSGSRRFNQPWAMSQFDWIGDFN
jgi:glutamine cyclotransferase